MSAPLALTPERVSLPRFIVSNPLSPLVAFGVAAGFALAASSTWLAWALAGAIVGYSLSGAP